MTYKDLINTNYDDAILAHSSFRCLPWIGRDFGKTPHRVLVLGESDYDWGGGVVADEEHLRYWHARFALGNSKKQYTRNLERALWGRKDLRRRERDATWLRTAYHNLVIERLPSNKHRPNYRQYVDGWEVALKLIDLLRIDRVIMYGLESQKRNSLLEVCQRKAITRRIRALSQKVSRSKPRIFELENNNRNTKIFFMRHPSAFFSWRKWGIVMQNESFDGRSLLGTP